MESCFLPELGNLPSGDTTHGAGTVGEELGQWPHASCFQADGRPGRSRLGVSGVEGRSPAHSGLALSVRALDCSRQQSQAFPLPSSSPREVSGPQPALEPRAVAARPSFPLLLASLGSFPHAHLMSPCSGGAEHMALTENLSSLTTQHEVAGECFEL